MNSLFTSPLHVKFPAFLYRSDLFDGRNLGAINPKRAVAFEHETPGGRITYCGPGLTRDHFLLWKAIYLEAAVHDALGGGDDFDLSDEDLMAAAGVSGADYASQARVWELLHDLHNAHIGGETTRFKRPKGFFGFGGRLIFHERNDGSNRLSICFALEQVIALGGFEIVQLPRPVGAPKSRGPKPSGPGFVYILTNPSMPGLIKIGKTRLDRVEDRAVQLQSTGVPDAFEVAYACRTDDPDAVERVMHEAFGPKRVNGRREFFQVEPEQAIAVLSLHG